MRENQDEPERNGYTRFFPNGCPPQPQFARNDTEPAMQRGQREGNLYDYNPSSRERRGWLPPYGDYHPSTRDLGQDMGRYRGMHPTHNTWSQYDARHNQRRPVNCHGFRVHVPVGEGSGVMVDPYVRHQLKQDLRRGIGEPFDGAAPEKYWAWKLQLMEHIDEARCSAREILLILESNTTGDPRDIIRDSLYTFTDSQESLAKAVTRLDKRYGSDLVITRAINHKLDKFPKIQKTSQTDKMEKLLSLVRYIMASIPACPELTYLNFREGQKKIWKRMPDDFIRRWRRISSRSEQVENRPPTLECLYEQISDYVNENSDPNFHDDLSPARGKRALATSLAPKEREEESKLGASTRGPVKPSEEREEKDKMPKQLCPLHKNVGNHSLMECWKFKAMSWEE